MQGHRGTASRALALVVPIAFAMMIGGCGVAAHSGAVDGGGSATAAVNTSMQASSGAPPTARTQARGDGGKSTSLNRTQGTIQFLSTGDAKSFCDLLPIGAADKLIPGFSGVPLPTVVPHRALLPGSSSHTTYTSIVCNYQEGNAQLAAIWLHMGVLRPGVPLAKLHPTSSSATLTPTTVDGHSAVYEVDSSPGQVSLDVEVNGGTLDIEPYYTSQDPLRAAEQPPGPAEVKVAKAVADALITGKYAGTASSAAAAATPAGPFGLGATLADWAAHHPQSSFSPDAGNGPGSYAGSSGPIGPSSQLEWTQIEVRHNRIDYYNEYFPKGTEQTVAAKDVTADLPADAVVSSTRTAPDCAWFSGRSATLARALGSIDPTGVFDVILMSPDSSAYDPSNVSTGIISHSAPDPSDWCGT